MDDRNKQVAYEVIAVMYFLTIVAMQGIVKFIGSLLLDKKWVILRILQPL